MYINIYPVYLFQRSHVFTWICWKHLSCSEKMLITISIYLTPPILYEEKQWHQQQPGSDGATANLSEVTNYILHPVSQHTISMFSSVECCDTVNNFIFKRGCWQWLRPHNLELPWMDEITFPMLKEGSCFAQSLSTPRFYCNHIEGFVNSHH